MTTLPTLIDSPSAGPVPADQAGPVRRVLSLVERNFMIYRRSLTPVVFGLVEPVLYLLTIGYGVGSLVGSVPGVDTRYAAYVAPAILATTAMNTAVSHTIFGVFTRVKKDHTYEAIVPTPLSVTDIAYAEVTSAVINALITSVGFLAALAALGLVVSPGVLLAVPASVLVGVAFGAAGLAATTYLRDFADLQLVQLVMLPMFLFATTFYPLTVYPRPLQPFIEVLPLYQSIELIREPALGRFPATVPVAAGYLIVFSWLALRIAIRRMGPMLAR
ncbi:ABC transporter permease [Catenulispora yoronensis]|uniref:Transport permease protein n=1 Tax=Catenulispora yoronensis TaxID=450799 RepID=A0ABP5F2E1_9ACTN